MISEESKLQKVELALDREGPKFSWKEEYYSEIPVIGRAVLSSGKEYEYKDSVRFYEGDRGFDFQKELQAISKEAEKDFPEGWEETR